MMIQSDGCPPMDKEPEKVYSFDWILKSLEVIESNEQSDSKGGREKNDKTIKYVVGNKKDMKLKKRTVPE